MPRPSPTADLEEANALHRAGRFGKAKAAYARILQDHPETLEALHGLALMAIDLGQPAKALPLLARCIATDPGTPFYRMSLGLALLGKGDPEEAAAHFLDAANRMATPEPRIYLARALGQLGRWRQAVEVLAGTAEFFPGRADVWAAKGNAERMIKRHGAAEASLLKALALSPADADVLNNLGVVARARGRVEDAIRYYNAALAHTLARVSAAASATTSSRALIHMNLGNALAHAGQAIPAEHHLSEAVALDGESAEGLGSLATFLTRQDRCAEAIPLFRTAVTLAPRDANLWTNLGVALLDSGAAAEAEHCYRHAIALEPKNSQAHYNLAWALLLTGRWQEGWEEYEWRWALHNFSSRKRDFTQPLWDGAPLPQGTLLLHAEQGSGDAIQFVRYAALAKARCARVVVECAPALMRLFTGLAGIDTLIAAGTPLPAFDAHAPFMSLPRIFGTTPETVPPAAMFRPPGPSASLRLPARGRPRIGLVWAGSPDNKIDRRRTMAAAQWAPLVSRIAADFVSLQVGPGSAQIADLHQDKIIFVCAGAVADFADTATVLNQLDLVIGVDTAVMHLAASLGKTAYMLLPFMPDYRWLLSRSDSPWYPSIHLFRQEKPGEWSAPLAALEGAVNQLLTDGC